MEKKQVLTVEQAMAKLDALQAENNALRSSAPKTTTIKLNISGGLFVRHPSFIAFSKNKNKNYVAGINIPSYGNPAILKQMFLNPELLQQIQAFVKTLPDTLPDA